ncbi:MAG: carbamoyl phosphate synthase large subunit, partial [Coriobacteriales bacterium]|nr:carbamoyl phosphate synthase large subunit [Coriobacteriales bacterium]
SALLDEMKIAYPSAGDANSIEEALDVAARIGYPLLVRPSYVLGGRGMVIAYDEEYLVKYVERAAKVSPDHPLYLDAFLENATEVDVDALCDGKDVYIGAILEHIEEAGIHSGDSACCTPPFSLSESVLETIRKATIDLALAVNTRGLLNIQYAIKGTRLFVIEVNPRASRTVPFVSKSSGVPLAKAAAKIMAGATLKDLGLKPTEIVSDIYDIPKYYSVKEAVMPFGRFPGSSIVLGPEMKSTGEVMGVSKDFPSAYAKTQLSVSNTIQSAGKAFISVCDSEKRNISSVALSLTKLGFRLVATIGTARTLLANGLDVEIVRRSQEESPNILDMMQNDEIDLVVNIPFGQGTRGDAYKMRSAAVNYGIPYVTTLSAASVLAQALQSVRQDKLFPIALQDLFQMEL